MSAEREVIGQILMDQAKLQSCDLLPEDFISSQYREIYREVLDMSQNREAIDPFSVAERLEAKTGVNYRVICCEAANEAFCYTTFENQVEHVRRYGKVHKVRAMLNGALLDLDREKDLSVVDGLVQALMDSTRTRKNHAKSLQKAIKSTLDRMEEVKDIEGLLGIRTGITKLDEILGGFHKSDLIVIGARPAMGKTAFLINSALAGAQDGCVGIFSAEQDADQVAERCLAIKSSVDSRRIRTAKMNEGEWAALGAAGASLYELQVEIYDEPGMSIATLIRQAREWKYTRDLKAIYVDYIQNIEPFTAHAYKRDSVGEVAKALKNLARELKIPVIALAQVSRLCEGRENKRPGQADLSDSSQIEKEADEIITIYRDEVYYEKTVDKGIAELIICKNRHGGTGVIRTLWNGPSMQFKDLDWNSR